VVVRLVWELSIADCGIFGDVDPFADSPLLIQSIKVLALSANICTRTLLAISNRVTAELSVCIENGDALI